MGRCYCTLRWSLSWWPPVRLDAWISFLISVSFICNFSRLQTYLEGSSKNTGLCVCVVVVIPVPVTDWLKSMNFLCSAGLNTLRSNVESSATGEQATGEEMWYWANFFWICRRWLLSWISVGADIVKVPCVRSTSTCSFNSSSSLFRRLSSSSNTCKRNRISSPNQFSSQYFY